jgi:hypothetical protein
MAGTTAIGAEIGRIYYSRKYKWKTKTY